MREVQSVAEPSTLAFGFSDQRLTQEGWTPLSSKATACWVSTTGGHRPGTDVSQPNPCEASANLPTLCRWDLERMQSKHSYEYQLEVTDLGPMSVSQTPVRPQQTCRLSVGGIWNGCNPNTAMSINWRATDLGTDITQFTSLWGHGQRGLTTLSKG